MPPNDERDVRLRDLAEDNKDKPLLDDHEDENGAKKAKDVEDGQQLAVAEAAAAMPADLSKNQVVEAIGDFGKWQLLRVLFVLAFVWIPGGFHMLNLAFFRAHTDHWCAKPEGLSAVSNNDWRKLIVPLNPDGKSDSCNLYDVDFEALYKKHGDQFDQIKDDPEYLQAVESGKLKPCQDYNGWDYDRSFWKRTIIQEWDLVCHRAYLAKLAQQITFAGILVGVFVTGMASDRYGRVPTMIGIIIMTAAFGTAGAFAPTYEVLLCCLFFCGFASVSFGSVSFCWMVELIGGRAKTICACCPHLNFAVSGLLVALIAYLIPDWRNMQLVFSLPLLGILSLYFVLPESPRWLITQNRLPEAEKILRSIAEFNGKPLPPDFKLYAPQHSISTDGKRIPGKGLVGFFDLFRTPNMRMKTLIVYYMWFSASMVYYGLTLNSNNFGASLFVYFSIGKAIEIPFITLVIVLLVSTGRRISLIIVIGIGATGLLLTMFIPTGYFAYEWPIVVLNIIGRGASIGTMMLCYVYSGEVFPTVARNIGIGSSSLWARVGPIIAPYVADLSWFDPRLPTAVFGIIGLLACFLVTFLPETKNHKLPDTIKESEELGKGDTLYASCCKCGAPPSSPTAASGPI